MAGFDKEVQVRVRLIYPGQEEREWADKLADLLERALRNFARLDDEDAFRELARDSLYAYQQWAARDE